MAYRFNTLALHGGHQLDSSLSRAVPIYQTTSYLFEDSQHAADLFALKKFGNIYTRIMNPTTDVFEKRMSELSNGVGALAVASGQSAITLAILGIAQNGQEIISTNSLYGGTYTLFHYTLSKMGIKVHFFDPDDYEGIKKAINKKTRLIYSESLGNPKLDIIDIEKLARIAHQANLPLIIDNTSLTPYLLDPFKFGADIAVYSATKFIGGHGTSIGGIIVDSGNFDWEAGDFPELTEADPSYHGMNFVKDLKPFGNIAYIVKLRVSYLRDIGPAISPFNSFLLLQGLETLPLRMQRHCENALETAKFLDQHPQISWVNYPGLTTHKNYQLKEKYLPNGQGALIGFGIKGGKNAGIKFINEVKLLSHLANIGDAKSLVIHPASTTHQQLSEKEQFSAGVSPDYIRLSVGIEDIEDIKQDINQALKKASS